MAAAAAMRVSFPEPDIALITLDAPDKSANIFSRSVLEELDGHLAGLEKRSDLAGLIFVSAKPGIFIAGADLREFAAAKDIKPEDTVAMCRRGQELFRRLARAPFVTVAAIDGVCVGGGAELAVWCDRRVMSDRPQAQIGFPEVKIGIFPGWGGTVRTPRIVGLSNALEMISSGESIDSRAAALMGLANDVVPAEKLLPAAIALVRNEKKSGDYLRDRERWAQPIVMSDTELAFLGATASAYIQQQTKGQYPAPLAALELMLGATALDETAACVAEAEGMAALFGTPISRALINVFFLTDRNKKDPGVADASIKPAAIKTVGIIGAGIMGSGIAAATVKRKLTTVITDAATESLQRGVRQVLEEVSYNKQTKKPDVQRTLEFAPLVNAATDDAEFAPCDLVIEAIVEKPDAKQALFKKLELRLRDDAILASNTSAISIGRLAEAVKKPERFCGIHFFNPVRKMPLVEVIRGPKTSDQTIATAVAYAKGIGKSPIVVNDGPGFLVNRLLLPYMNEALELLLEGASIKDVDKAAKAFGMPIGPIGLYDVVGLDTAYHAGNVMHEAFPDRVGKSPLLEAMVKAGRLGEKSGIGFSLYTGKKGKPTPDPALDQLIAPLVREQRKISGKEITERLFLPMVLEATRVLEEKIVRDPRDVDLGLIFGIGFPPFKGGLLFWADTIGAKQLIEQLKPYAHLGERMKPTKMLERLAAEGRTFYDQ